MASSMNTLQHQSIHCVFLAYASHYKGYHCLSPATRCIYVSHHVRFHETQYLFPNLVSNTPHVLQSYVFHPMKILHPTSTVSLLILVSVLPSPTYGPTAAHTA